MIRLEIPPGTRAPNHYGVAYANFDKDTTVFYPVPLHLIVRHARNAWFWFRYTKNRTFREETEHSLFMQGQKQGFMQGNAQGFNRGYAEGREQGRKEVQENFLEVVQMGATSLRQWLDGRGMEIRVKDAS